MRLYVLCEGETENRFVKNILYDYLVAHGIYAIPRTVHTKKLTTGKAHKGGVSSYAKIRKDLYLLCKEQENSGMVTTMFDFYKLPSDTPGFKDAKGNIYERAEHIENAIQADLGDPRNVYVNLIVHEFEGLLFSNTNAFLGVANTSDKVVAELRKILEAFETPEHINDSEMTAPSKRIARLIPEYSKTLNGIEVAERIGIDGIASQCRHFGQWVAKVKELAKNQ